MFKIQIPKTKSPQRTRRCFLNFRNSDFESFDSAQDRFVSDFEFIILEY